MLAIKEFSSGIMFIMFFDSNKFVCFITNRGIDWGHDLNKLKIHHVNLEWIQNYAFLSIVKFIIKIELTVGTFPTC